MTIQAKQTIQQHVMFAPNVTMALEVLRMPTMELQTFLERQLEENPLLELDDSPDDDETSAQPEPNQTDDATPTNGLDEEWASHWQAAGEREETDEFSEDDRLVDQRASQPQSLHESLLLQLGCQSLAAEDRRLAEILIQHLDDAGYLEEPLTELAAELGERLERLEAVLRIIQQCDPPGVGARDLRECLMLQLQERGLRESLAYTILADYFPLFTEHRLAAIAKAAETSLESVTKACECLRQLNPKPGRAFTADLPPCVVPDLLVHHREQHYDVELNDPEVPRLRINRIYHRMLRNPTTPADAKAFLTEKLRKASWLIKAIDERNTTLLAIARCLISLQRDFLEQGPRSLKPLTQAQVAQLIGRHPSTVSRAICGKTIDTPYGVFRLEQLFASGIPQADQTTSVSDKLIKAELQRLLAEENPAQPFSDAALAKRLAERNLVVARRTIAKYRSSLKILPAYLRRRL